MGNWMQDHFLQNARLTALAMVPMAAALAGAFVDERSRLGVTVWRSACRASGMAPRSVIVFTLELLPTAVLSALAGGLLLLVTACAAGTAARARHSLAAHLGCTVAMPVGALLCALTLPLPLMLAVDAILAGATATVAQRAMAGVGDMTLFAWRHTQCPAARKR